MSLTHIFLFTILVIAALLLFGSAHAETVLWNEVQPNLIDLGNDKNRTTIHLNNASVSILYGASMFEVDGSGTKIRPLASGAEVPIGTRVLLEFKPHEYTDIAWFGTGAAYDTPYGDWVANAGHPVGSLCLPRNLFASNLRFQASRNTGSTNLYAALSVAPPTKHAQTNGADAACVPSGAEGNQICTLNNPGLVSGGFNFDPTLGEFYAAEARGCGSSGHPMMLSGGDKSTAGDYTLQVPLQTIPFTITVLPGDPDSTPPTKPSLSAGAACVVGTPHAISMTTTDPDGDQIRYGIDWDANGTIDQFVPPSGYVPSGTPQAASRTYSTAGTKAVKVKAQDERGQSSEWATFSFSCAEDGSTGASASGDNSGADGDSGDSAESGFIGDGGSFFGAGSPENNLSIRAVPSLVRRGDTTQIHWSASQMEFCTVGGNGNAWDGLLSPVGGESSNPIEERTDYTLSCLGLDGLTYERTAVANISPSFEER